MRTLHDDFALVPADKAPKNLIIVCKQYKIETSIKELGVNTTNISSNSTYIPSTDSSDKIPKSHCKFIEMYDVKTGGKMMSDKTARSGFGEKILFETEHCN